MRKTIVTSLILMMSLPAAAQHGPEEIMPEAIAAVQAACREAPYSMRVTVRNIKDAKGIITVDVHNDDPALWLKKGGKLVRLRIRPEKGQVEFCAPVEKAGQYALAVYQDKDVNFEMNRNFLGLPAEPYGVSNDAPINFGPPKLKDALVTVNGPHTPVRITLHN
jgi:uncharacterized protein (DUF2141 family)